MPAIFCMKIIRLPTVLRPYLKFLHIYKLLEVYSKRIVHISKFLPQADSQWIIKSLLSIFFEFCGQSCTATSNIYFKKLFDSYEFDWSFFCISLSFALRLLIKMFFSFAFSLPLYFQNKYSFHKRENQA